MFAQAYLWLSLSHVSFYEGLVPVTGKAQGEWICGGMGCFSAADSVWLCQVSLPDLKA